MNVHSRKSSAASTAPGEGGVILRLVRRASDRAAIAAGQVDAVLDAGTGRAILLPEAQTALLERKAWFCSLVELTSDGYWEQDEQFRFTMHSGMQICGGTGGTPDILGRQLWDLPFENGGQIDWQTFRTQLEWRAVFRDLALRFVDGVGRLRCISISGEPMFDAQARFKGYCGIVRDDTARRETEITARQTGQFAHAALDSLAVPVCVLDAAGTIMVANAAWRRLAAGTDGGDAGMAVGRNYLVQCDQIVGDERVDRAATAAGIRQVIAGERELFRYPHYYGAAPEERWALATVTRLQGDTAGGALVSHEDLTDARRAEQLLRLECNVASSLAGAENIAAGLQSVLRAVCEVQRWDRGRYFRLDEDSRELVLQESWGEPAAAAQQLREAPRHAVSAPGAGLADRACQSRRAQWVLDAGKDLRAAQTALAHETDLGGAFSFPVLAGKQSLGALVFASRAVQAVDERLLQAAHSISEQVGQFLRRRQADDSVRHNEAQFRDLLELSVDWWWEQDEQFRYVSITGSGMACIKGMLGRTLWEVPGIVVDDDPEWSRHKSELAAQWSFCDLQCAVARADGRMDYYLISGAPVYSEAGVFTGFHGTGLDISHGRRTEIALRAADPTSAGS